MSAPAGRESAGLDEFAKAARWSFSTAWDVSAPVLWGIVTVALARSLLPAALALTARGLVNASVAALSGEVASIAPLVPWLGLGFLLTTLEGISALASRLFSQRLVDEIEASVTADVLTAAAQRELAYFEDPRFQDELSRVQRNPAEQIATFIVDAVSAVGSLLQVTSLLGVLVFIEPLILVLAAAGAAPYLFFQARLATKQYALEFARATKHRWMRYFVSTLTDRVTAAEVKILRLGPSLIDKFRALMREFRDQDRTLHVQGFRGGTLFVTATTAAIYVLFLRVAYLVVDGRLTLGDLAIFGGAATRLRNALEALVGTLSNLIGRVLRLRDVERFLGASAPAENGGVGHSHGDSDTAIEFDDVAFTYPGSAEPALKGISFRIQAGETVAIFGRNGAGKSTLVKLIAGLYEPTAGRIRFRGVDSSSLRREDLYKEISFVFQDFARFEASAADNIAYGNWQALRDNRAEVEALARAAGVESMIQALPGGFETQLGRSFGDIELSGGQWQQIAVARAFAGGGSLLILDEPTSQLDARTEYEFFQRFRVQARRRGTTTLIVSHRLSTVKLADRILVLDGSRLVETGSHEELIGKGGTYAHLYALRERQG